MKQGHAYLCGLILLVLGQTGYGSRPRRDDGLIMKVTTIEDHPYMMVKNPSKSGNDNFEGFIPDLLNEISDNIRVGYNLELVADNRYGENQGGQWTGMVGALVRKRADLAAAPLTMSDEREEVIDFTEPFMDVGLSALYKKSDDGEKRPFDTLEELVEDNDMQYGLLRGGMTENFFSQSKNETIKKIWDKIQKMASPGGRFSNSNDGQKKVRESGGKFVFFMESATADYYKNKKSCELDTLPIAKKNKYAFGVQKGSEFKTGINKAIKQLKESGRIQEIRDKWWTGECVPRDKGNSIHTTMTSASLVLLGASLYLML